MLIRKHDAAHSEDEWRQFLRGHDFGQLVASGRGRDVPVIVPAHYAFDGERTILTHLARDNPMFDALEENPRAVLAVIGAYTYIPTDWNAGADEDPEWGVPTSYYAAVQAIGRCDLVDDDEGMAEILRVMLAALQPEGGYRPVEPGDNPYARQFRAIRGIRLTIDDVRAKFKFGGNRPLEHREKVARLLAARDAPLDADALAHLARRSGLGEGPHS